MVYSHAKRARLSAVCDINPHSARAKGRKYDADRVLTDYDSMLKLDLDLIDVVTPTATHAKLSQLALESGHNVLVEKPMALSSRECEEMINSANKNGRMLCVAHNLRFLDSVIGIKNAIERESLRASKMRFSYFFAQPFPGFMPKWVLTEENKGILWEAVVHSVYLSEYLLGRTESVYAVANRFNQPVYDSITVLLQSESRPSICEYDFDVKETQRALQAMTTAGDRFDADLTHDFLLRRSRGRSSNRWKAAFRSFRDDFSGPLSKWSGHILNFMKTRSYRQGLPMEKTCFRLIEQFLRFIGGESSASPVSAEEGLQSIKVLEAAARSIENGKPQAIR